MGHASSITLMVGVRYGKKNRDEPHKLPPFIFSFSPTIFDLDFSFDGTIRTQICTNI